MNTYSYIKYAMSTENEQVLIMKLLASATRQKILQIIYHEKEDLCVNEIAKRAGVSQSLASHQLAYLSAYGIVEGHKMGQTTCYIPATSHRAKKVFNILHIIAV